MSDKKRKRRDVFAEFASFLLFWMRKRQTECLKVSVFTDPIVYCFFPSLSVLSIMLRTSKSLILLPRFALDVSSVDVLFFQVNSNILCCFISKRNDSHGSRLMLFKRMYIASVCGSLVTHEPVNLTCNRTTQCLTVQETVHGSHESRYVYHADNCRW